MFYASKHLKHFLVLQIYLSFICFSNAFNLGANKENLLHVTNCIIPLLSIYQNSFILKWLQHVMSLTYTNSVV